MFAFSLVRVDDRRLPPSARMLVCGKDTARRRSSMVKPAQLVSHALPYPQLESCSRALSEPHLISSTPLVHTFDIHSSTNSLSSI